MKVKVKFITNAQIAGVGYRRGQVAELRDDVAMAYIRAEQCEPYIDPPADVKPDTGDDAAGDDAAPSGRKPAQRAGRKVETSSRGKTEQR